jgi:hypothetical protein
MNTNSAEWKNAHNTIIMSILKLDRNDIDMEITMEYNMYHD